MPFAFGKMQTFVKNGYGLNFNDITKFSIGKCLLSKHLEFVYATSITDDETSDRVRDRVRDRDHPHSFCHNNCTENASKDRTAT